MSYNPKVVSFERSSAYVHHRAMINRRENNIVDALELMRHAVERAPDNLEYRLDLAELCCEMGLHEQSSRLLLDILAKDGAPAECYYGLALNQLGMNDIDGARQSLKMYRKAEPSGAHIQDAGRLASELDIFDAMNRPVSRRLFRAMKVADCACTALQEGDLSRAKRLFERSLQMSTEQYEMRAMYAMALMMDGEDDRALAEAERAAEGFPPSPRALCVASQVYAALDETQRAQELLHRVLEERPTGVELRLLIFSLGEVGMHKEIDECARLALQETPHDRQLLHVRAAALHHLGMPDKQVARFWQRILRIDPEDSVAQFYHNACVNGVLRENAPGYTYEVPEEECRRRAEWLAGQFKGGFSGVQQCWQNDVGFRQIVLWAANADDEKLRRAAVTVIAAMDDEKAQSAVRSLLFRRDLQPELRNHTAMLLKLRGADLKAMLPAERVVEDMVLPEASVMLNELLVGERQLIRYADEVMEERYGISAEPELALLWSVYRRGRGTLNDPLINTETAAAALVYNYLSLQGQRPSLGKLAEQFGCSLRRLVFYAGRIADIIEHSEGETKDEDL